MSFKQLLYLLAAMALIRFFIDITIPLWFNYKNVKVIKAEKNKKNFRLSKDLLNKLTKIKILKSFA